MMDLYDSSDPCATWRKLANATRVVAILDVAALSCLPCLAF